jgi:hypothetical protein
MSKQISGAEYPLSKIFSSDFDYIIPSYQRPYAWTTEQASDLFDDLYDFFCSEQEDSYFLGSIVLIKEENKPRAEVIDGQQRLTTLTILLAALASKLSGDLKKDFESYIREPGRPSQNLQPKPRLTLRERDKDFFAQYVQGLDFDGLFALDPAQLSNESQRNIQQNSRFLLDHLTKNFQNNEDDLRKFGSFIVQRCFLVVVSTPNQKSAFRVFSVMNNRGLDLLTSDIIKADAIGKIIQEQQEEYTNRWEEIEVQTGRDGFNELLMFIRMIYAKEKTKGALFEEFNKHVLTRIQNTKQLIEDVIEPYAEAYLIVKGCKYEATECSQDVNSYLNWLNRIDNSDWIPPAIQFLLKRNNEPKYVRWFFGKLERLAAYLHICAKNVNQRIERYAEVLNELGEEEHSLNSPLKSIELKENEIRAMLEAISGKVYELSPRRRNYLILRLDSFLSDGAATYDPNILTIEHVLPQTVKEGSPWLEDWPDEVVRNEWVHRIANLVPLTQKRNSKAQNFSFDKKKKAYFGGRSNVSSYALTTQVLHIDRWTPEVIRKRQQELVDVISKGWSLQT